VLIHGQRAGLEGIDSRHTHLVRRKRWHEEEKKVAAHHSVKAATSFQAKAQPTTGSKVSPLR
jgi:hypothetical protein